MGRWWRDNNVGCWLIAVVLFAAVIVAFIAADTGPVQTAPIKRHH